MNQQTISQIWSDVKAKKYTTSDPCGQPKILVDEPTEQVMSLPVFACTDRIVVRRRTPLDPWSLK